MSATPEQYAAVSRILGCEAEGREQRAESGRELELEDGENIEQPIGDGAPRSASPAVSEDVARSAFALLVRLDAEGGFKAPSPLTVFRLYCVDGHSAEQVARKCRCGKATVIRRLQFIERQTNTKPEDFRAMSGHLQQMDDDLRDSGAREIYRRGLTQGDEE
jgi:hypothetical protein